MLLCCILTLGSATHLPAAAAPHLFVQTLGLCNCKSFFFFPFFLSPFGLNSATAFIWSPDNRFFKFHILAGKMFKLRAKFDKFEILFLYSKMKCNDPHYIKMDHDSKKTICCHMALHFCIVSLSV